MAIDDYTFLKRGMEDNDLSELFGSNIEVSTYAIKIIKKYYSKVKTISPNHSIVYRGDFYSLLTKYGVPSFIHYLTGLINGFKTSTDLKNELSEIYVIDPSYLSNIETLLRNEKKEQIMTV